VRRGASAGNAGPVGGVMRADQLEQRLRERLDASRRQPKLSCSASSCSPTSTVPSGSEAPGGPKVPHLRQLLIDREEDRAVLVGMLREPDR
jgi:hypothetical protein